MTDIQKSFGGVHALNGIHFELREGEIHALLGENGAGKSTLIKVLGGSYRPDRGTTVSYTHLDVYKRQPVHLIELFALIFLIYHHLLSFLISFAVIGYALWCMKSFGVEVLRQWQFLRLDLYAQVYLDFFVKQLYCLLYTSRCV